MNSVSINEGLALPSDHPAAAADGMALQRRLMWLREWERAFESTRDHHRVIPSDARVEVGPSRVSVENARIDANHVMNESSRNTDSGAIDMFSDRHGSNFPRPGQGTITRLTTAAPSMRADVAAGTVLPAWQPNLIQSTAPSRESASAVLERRQAAYERYTHSVHVSHDPDGITIGIRDRTLSDSLARALSAAIRQEMVWRGYRISRITVNGTNLWRAASMESDVGRMGTDQDASISRTY